MDNRVARHFPWIGWIFLIAFLSFLPGDKFPEITWEFIGIDKLVHFGIYFLLAILMVFGFSNKKLNLSQLKVYFFLLLAGILFGIFVELIQGKYIYQRYFDPADILANALGTIFGLSFVRLIGRKL